MKKRLPPLKAMIALESVVRLGSVTEAASELTVTHGAVSKQIATLEDWFGRRLFHKNRKQMLPTSEALKLANVASDAFGMIGEAVADLERTPDTTLLRILAPSTFAMRWLLPRVWSLSVAEERVALQIRQTDSDEKWEELPFDVAIRRDLQPQSPWVAVPFLNEKLTLVVAPHCADRLQKPTDLSQFPVLCASTRPGELQKWLTAAGVSSVPKRIEFPHFYLALEAALAGAGALVCHRETIGDILARSDLIEPWPSLLVDGPVYAAVYDSNSPRLGAVGAFVSWLSIAGSLSPTTQS